MSKEYLISQLVNNGKLKTPAIIEAFKKIDRRDFVSPKHRDQAYEDFPIPIGYESTISQPTTVATMLEILSPQRGDRVLDVGSGSGWTTALLANIVGPEGSVYGVELIPELVSFGRHNTGKYNFKNARIFKAEKSLGWKKEAPYDKILVSASADSLPEELLNQLKKNGKMVIPIKSSIWQIEIKEKGEIQKKEYPGFVFVPLR